MLKTLLVNVCELYTLPRRIQRNLPRLHAVIETLCGNRAIMKAAGLGMLRCGFLLGVHLSRVQSVVEES